MVTNEFVAVCKGEKDISKTAEDVSSRTTNLQDQRRFGDILLYFALKYTAHGADISRTCFIWKIEITICD